MATSSQAVLKVGVIGAGAVAHMAYLPILARSERCFIEGVVARTEKSRGRVARIYNVKATFSSVDDLLSTKDLDCAFVLTPDELHEQHARKLLEAGVHVLCEKPLSRYLDECYQMADLSEKKGRILMVAFNRRFSPVYQRAWEELSGIKCQSCLVRKSKNRRQARALISDAIHVVDVMRWFCTGEMIKVFAIGEEASNHEEKSVSAIVEFSRGSQGIFLMNREAGQWEEKVDVYGSTETIHINYPMSIRIIRNNQIRATEVIPESWGTISVEETWGFKNMINHFFDCIIQDEEPLTSAQDAVMTHELVHKIYTAAHLPGLERS